MNRTRIVTTATLLILILGVVSGWSALPTISLDLEPRQITVGDPIEVVLRLKAPPGATIFWPIPESFAPAEIISIDTLAQVGDEQAIKYLISLYEPGSSELPDLPVVVQNDQGLDTIWVDPGRIEVLSVLSPEDSLAGLRDIKPPIMLAWTWQEVLPWVIGILIVVLLGLTAWILWRRYKRSRGELPEFVPPPPPPYSTAFRRLEQLRVKELWQKGELIEYYSELTEILKNYIGGRFGIEAPEMTSTELMWARKKWAQNEEQVAHVKTIINASDLVKFAKYTPSKEVHPACLEAGFNYLIATKPDEKVPPEVGTNIDAARPDEGEN